MASVNLKGFLRQPLGELSGGDSIKFTHLTNTGEVTKGSVSYQKIGDDGYYDINIEYGNVAIETKDGVSGKWTIQGTSTINQDTTAKTLPDLFNSLIPASDPLIIQLQTILADATQAKDDAQSSAGDAAKSADLIAYLKESIVKQNQLNNQEYYPASGFTHFGLHEDGNINKGMWLDNGVIKVGGTKGDSKTKYPEVHINGHMFSITDDFILPVAPTTGERVDMFGVEVNISNATQADKDNAEALGFNLWVQDDGLVRVIKLTNRTFQGGNSDWFNLDSTTGNLHLTQGVEVNSIDGLPLVQDSINQGLFTDGANSWFLVIGTVLRYYTKPPQEIEMLTNVVDFRLTCQPGMDSPEESAKVREKVEDYSYLGEENRVYTNVYVQSYQDNPPTSGNLTMEVGVNHGVKVGSFCYSGYDASTWVGKMRVISVSATSFVVGVTDGQLNTRGPYVVVEQKTETTVSGNFTTKDVIGEPSNILKCDDLKGGWLGSWIPVIPPVSGDIFPATRKILTAPMRTRTEDNGVTWISGVAAWDATTNTVSHGYGGVAIIKYTAFGRQTKESTNKPVLNGEMGLLGVIITQDNEDASFTESVASVITKSNSSGIITESSAAIKYLIESEIKRIKTIATDMVTPNNSSQAVKVGVYQASENGKLLLGFIANTMTHNGANWGELEELQIPTTNSGTFQDSNGITQIMMSSILSKPYAWLKKQARAGGASKSGAISTFTLIPNYYGAYYNA